AALEQMGNSLGRAVYEANVPDNFRRPQTDSALESFIRAKYEQKKYIAKEWVPQPPPKIDWEKEIEDEEKLKKKKKAASNASTGVPIAIPPPTSGEKKNTNISNSKTATIPPPLPKISNLNSPKSNRPERKSTSSNGSSDLLGLNTSSTETKNDSFASFLSTTSSLVNTSTDNIIVQTKSDNFSSLDKEEADFFNQTTADAASKLNSKANMTKENILALYAANPVNNFQNFNGTHTPNYASQNPTMPIPGVFAQPNAYAQPFPVNNQFMANTNPLLVQQHQQQQQFMPTLNMSATVNNQWGAPNPLTPQQKFMPPMGTLPTT
ncbi:unnamed protein product, partial [Sphagnum compactum]